MMFNETQWDDIFMPGYLYFKDAYHDGNSTTTTTHGNGHGLDLMIIIYVIRCMLIVMIENV